MAAINNVVLVGRVVRDLEVKTTNSGKSVASFALAVDGYGKDAPANFIDCVAWNKAAEILGEYATKGRQIGITGRIQTRPWEDKEGNKRKATEVIIDQFQLLGGKSDGAGGAGAPAAERDGLYDDNRPMTQTQALNGGKDVVIEDIDDRPIDLSEIPF